MDSLSLNELRVIAKQYGLSGKTKKDLVKSITDHHNNLKKWVNYTCLYQLGTKGKDGRTFLVQNKNGAEYAMKVFEPSKNPVHIQREVDLQTIAAREGVAPSIFDYDITGRFIVMEKLDKTLYDYFVEQGGQLTIPQQKDVVRMFRRLDKCSVFHNDPNPLNFMKRGRKWFTIDYGLAKRITPMILERWGETPNERCMALGLIIHLRRIHKDALLTYLELASRGEN